VEIIADGRHLPDSLLKLIYKIKGVDKISLITDATRGCSLPEGTKTFIGPKEDAEPIIIENGVAFIEDRTSFAGSTATFDRLYKVMSKIVDGDMVALSKMASTNPAKILGLGDRGVIEKGKIADLLIVDDKFEIEKIIYKGNIVR
jgi:N-acetylglucosamine-6-phosphate deacetylase